jgi:hypothetical protein
MAPIMLAQIAWQQTVPTTSVQTVRPLMALTTSVQTASQQTAPITSVQTVRPLMALTTLAQTAWQQTVPITSVQTASADPFQHALRFTLHVPPPELPL